MMLQDKLVSMLAPFGMFKIIKTDLLDGCILNASQTYRFA